MGSYKKNKQKINEVIAILTLILTLLFSQKTVYAQTPIVFPTTVTKNESVTVSGFVPVSDYYANEISTRSKVFTKKSLIKYNEKIPVYIQLFDEDQPLRLHKVVLSSPQQSDNLQIIQPASPTDSSGETVGYISSKYTVPDTYIIIATDTSYSDTPIVISESTSIDYVPNDISTLSPLEKLKYEYFLYKIFFNFLCFILAVFELIFIEGSIIVESREALGIIKKRIFRKMLFKFLWVYAIALFILYIDTYIFNWIGCIILTIIGIQYFIFELTRS